MLDDEDRKTIGNKLFAMETQRIKTSGDPEMSALLEGWEQALEWVLRTL